MAADSPTLDDEHAITLDRHLVRGVMGFTYDVPSRTGEVLLLAPLPGREGRVGGADQHGRPLWAYTGQLTFAAPEDHHA